MSYIEEYNCLLKEVEDKVLPAILFYTNAMRIENFTVQKTGIGVVCVARNYGQYFSRHTHDLAESTYQQIHNDEVKRLKALIYVCEDLKDRYEEVLPLIEKCKKLEIKEATRIVLFEKVK